ncbi:MAG: hypothetical protein EA401_00520 [Planctomycetota bacterium]|nr:MAG: hypothetical protein EA401_00520 [Planctomycetota bacterium]
MMRNIAWVTVAAVALIASLSFLLQMPWAWQLITLGAIGIISVITRRVCINLANEPIETVQFVTCPHCGTRNPRHSQRVYECYHCERRFSELSGRHPALPEQVAGVSSS